jgi:hypothetical protein
MTAAVFDVAPAHNAETSTKLSRIAKRCINAIVESRMRSVQRQMRRHHSFMNDLGRKQDHSSLFLDQSDLLPFKL